MANWKATSGDDYMIVRSLETVGVSELVKYLKSKPHIEKLSIWCNKIEGEGKELSSIEDLDSISVEIADADHDCVKVVSEMTHLTSLKVSEHSLTSEDAKRLSKCINLVKLVVHDSTTKQIDDQPIKGVSSIYVESLARLTNLTELRLKNHFVNDEFVELLADANCFHNIIRLDFSGNRIGDPAAFALAKSLSFSNLAYLTLKKTNIGWEGVYALALPSTLQNLQTVDLTGSDLHDVEGVEKLSMITYSRTQPLLIFNNNLGIFYGFLKDVLSNERGLHEILVGSNLCAMTKGDHDKIILKYLISQKEKYPLRLNSNLKGRHRYCIFDSFLGQPGGEKILFEHGALPAAISESEKTTLQVITEDGQSVHMPFVVRKTKFLTQYLVDSVKATQEEVEEALKSFTRYIPNLIQRYRSNPILLNLLNLTDSEKRRVMEKTLRGRSLPSDKMFVKCVIRTAEKTLNKIENYSDTRLRYDYTIDEATVTIPQCVGYIKLLIDTYPVGPEEKIELLVTLMEQNPRLVEQKLDKRNFDRPQLYEWVKTIKNEDMGELFLSISGLDIDQTWREQKEFVLLKQIYISATAYGPNNSACANGIWAQIVASLDEIDYKVLNLYEQQLEKERDRERLMPIISTNNSSELANNLARKLIEYAAFRPSARKSLKEFVFVMFDLNNFKRITFERQQILAQLNREFTLNVKTFLPNYAREIPTQEEYDIVIKNVLKSEVLQDFAKGARSSNKDLKINGGNCWTVCILIGCVVAFGFTRTCMLYLKR